jgi:hypothetical protein
MKILLLIVFSLSSLYAAESGGVDELSLFLGDMSFAQSQVDQLSGLFGNLSMQKAPQITQLISLLIKTMAYDSQPQSNGQAMATLIGFYSKKIVGKEISLGDRAAFSLHLKTGEPDCKRKKIAEEILFALMSCGEKSLSADWQTTAGHDQIAVFDQLEAWRELSCDDLASILPLLPLEYMFSEQVALESSSMDLD